MDDWIEVILFIYVQIKSSSMYFLDIKKFYPLRFYR